MRYLLAFALIFFVAAASNSGLRGAKQTHTQALHLDQNSRAAAVEVSTSGAVAAAPVGVGRFIGRQILVQSTAIELDTKEHSIAKAVVNYTQTANDLEKPQTGAATLPTVEHTKGRGAGYAEGSPLYTKQRAAQMQQAASQGPAHPDEPPAFVVLYFQAVDYMRHHSMGSFHGALVYIILVCVVAFLYRQFNQGHHYYHMHEILPYEGEHFTFGLIDMNCRHDWQICLMACCCPAIRWADTVSKDKLPMLNFWIALAMVVTLQVLQAATMGATLVLFILLGVFFRQKLRYAFGHTGKASKTLPADLLTWICCPCCALVQEAREVEQVRRKQ